MKKLILFILIISGSLIYSQENNSEIPVNFSLFWEPYFHPGFQIGYENNFHKGLNFTVSIGFFIHQKTQAGLFFSGGLNWRFTFSSGYSPETGIGLGYLHTWVHGDPTYIVDNEGNISIKPKAGRSHFMPLVKLGFLGWDLRENTDIPMRINSDIIIYGQYPFNNYVLPHLAFNTGITYYFEINQE